MLAPQGRRDVSKRLKTEGKIKMKEKGTIVISKEDLEKVKDFEDFVDLVIDKIVDDIYSDIEDTDFFLDYTDVVLN